MSLSFSLLDQDRDFEPTRNAKHWWLYTRKSSTVCAGVTLPGLFQTSQFFMDTLGFFGALTLELFGLYMLYSIGQIILFFTVSYFLADVILAISRHIPQGKICMLMNEIVISNDPKEIFVKIRRIRNRKIIQYVLSIFIVGMASFKVFSFYAMIEALDPQVVIVCMSYLIVAYLHIKCTGYFLFEILAWYLVRRDRNRYFRGAGCAIGDHRRHFFNANPALVNAEIHLSPKGSHRLHHTPPEGDGNAHALETWGVLIDAQLHILQGGQMWDEQRRVVAVEGLKHQLNNILSQDPV